MTDRRILAVRTWRDRYGSRLEHGCAHAVEHARWSRRDFLASMGLLAGCTVMLGSTPVHALARSSLTTRLQQVSSERVLVLIQLFGGNDGLNTVVPVDDDEYYRVRPRISIPKNSTISISDSLGFHPGFKPLESMYGDGNMAVMQSVGYPEANLSHFRSTDIWLSASDADVFEVTGWSGRHLARAYRNRTWTPIR